MLQYTYVLYVHSLVLGYLQYTCTCATLQDESVSYDKAISKQAGRQAGRQADKQAKSNRMSE